MALRYRTQLNFGNRATMNIIKKTTFYKKIKTFQNLMDQNTLTTQLWKEKEVQKEIVRLNNEAQLFEQGIGSDGNKLGEYTRRTILIKKRKGLPYKHVTLFDEGDLYQSTKVFPVFGGFKIRINTVKEGKDLSLKYGKHIAGLTKESKESLKSYIKPIFKKQFINRLRNS